MQLLIQCNASLLLRRRGGRRTRGGAPPRNGPAARGLLSRHTSRVLGRGSTAARLYRNCGAFHACMLACLVGMLLDKR